MNVLSIQSAVTYGHVGNSAAVFPLQRLGLEVWPVATVAFSNHPAHGGFRGRVVPAAEVAALVEGVAERGALAACDAVLSGYLGEAATGAVVAEAVVRVRAARPGALYCCDPVIGEVGRGCYVAAGVAEVIRDALVPLADIVTPNPFELEHLGGVAPRSLAAALAATDAIRARGPGLVVATGLRLDDVPGQVTVLAATDDGAWVVHAPHRATRAFGTGDVFAALFLGAFLLHGRGVPAALEHAVAAVDAVLARTGDAVELALVEAQEALARPPERYPARRVH
jgi:pyridoxine kinase